MSEYRKVLSWVVRFPNSNRCAGFVPCDGPNLRIVNLFSRAILLVVWFFGLVDGVVQADPPPLEPYFVESQVFADESAGQARDEFDAANDLQVELNMLRKRLESLEQREKKRTESDQKRIADEAAKKELESRKAESWVDLSSEKWTVKLGGHVQMEYINWANASASINSVPGAQDYFEFRRLRLVADGTGYGVYDFRLQMTLEPETVGENPAGTVTSPDVKDAYFSINEVPLLGRVRIGNFFVPFSLEQVTNDTNNIFMERSIPTQGVFAVDREVGVAAYNTSTDQRLGWAYGVFFDSVSESLKERIDDNQGYRLSGRVTYLPYYDELSNGRYLVHTGMGVLHTEDQDGRVRFRARPQIHEGPRLIDSGSINAKSYTTGNAELAVVWGAFTLQSEAFLSNIQLGSGGASQINGCYVHGSYFLTGENRIYERFGQHGAQFGRNAPYSNVFAVPGGVSLGAWEAKTRWSYLDLSELTKGQYNDLTAGLNWYWSDRVRIMFDWIHPMTSRGTPFGNTSSNILATRFDFNW